MTTQIHHVDDRNVEKHKNVFAIFKWPLHFTTFQLDFVNNEFTNKNREFWRICFQLCQ